MSNKSYARDRTEEGVIRLKCFTEKRLGACYINVHLEHCIGTTAHGRPAVRINMFSGQLLNYHHLTTNSSRIGRYLLANVHCLHATKFKGLCY